MAPELSELSRKLTGPGLLLLFGATLLNGAPGPTPSESEGPQPQGCLTSTFTVPVVNNNGTKVASLVVPEHTFEPLTVWIWSAEDAIESPGAKEPLSVTSIGPGGLEVQVQGVVPPGSVIVPGEQSGEDVSTSWQMEISFGPLITVLTLNVVTAPPGLGPP
jgi:hypothetical protein